MSPGNPASACSDTVQARPVCFGKSIYCGQTKLWIKGVTYGTFRPGASGNEFYNRSRIEDDFRQMSSNGFNAIRTYTVPPRWFLDLALRYGLYVMVGIPWEQHIAFLDSKERCRKIRREISTHVHSCAGHSAILSYALGNEIPSSIARWHGAERIERFLRDLWSDAKSEDPSGLFTYVNYPSTEYLNVDFADLCCFNVYLEDRQKLGDYIAHLHSIAGDRPLLLTELGLDSIRHGERKQTEVLESQVQTVFAEGCSGAFVFSWTDEWHRGGQDIRDWAFGLTTRNRSPKPALRAVSRALSQVPFPYGVKWPKISVVVCTYNGERTIRECLDGLLQVDYPDFEVIVVNDGSTDSTAEIAIDYPFRIISTENRGLSSARNTGMHAAAGEIIAYIDDDAYPSVEWLKYLALTFLNTDHAAVGGPNLPPPSDGFVAECVALAPGGPIHVLLSDREAEHLPGCNMAVRKSFLEMIGGFDPAFRVAGDDVDVCWRLQQHGFSLGFNAAAVVWHHRRNSVRAYWKQQRGYGKAEALLEAKWPDKYNGSGHPNWAGRIYSPGVSRGLKNRRRIFHGVWGGALFQSVYQPAPALVFSLASMPEWYLLIGLLCVLSGLGVFWHPLQAMVFVLSGAAGLAISQAVIQTVHACRLKKDSSAARFKRLAMTGFLHLVQPLARLVGRLRHGLSPWRRREVQGWAMPWLRRASIWSEHWRTHEDWLRSVEVDLRKARARVIRGGDYDRWDLEVSNGTLGSVRLMAAVEEHGAGRQLVRFRLAPHCALWVMVVCCFLALLSAAAAAEGARIVTAILGAAALALSVRMISDSGVAMSTILRTLSDIRENVHEQNNAICRDAGLNESDAANAVSLGQADH
jgi:glycosyltransferase involved in cell wall biosynthesis